MEERKSTKLTGKSAKMFIEITMNNQRIMENRRKKRQDYLNKALKTTEKINKNSKSRI